MATATLSSKGQLVIPKSVREYMRLQAGDRVDFVVQDDGEVVVRPAAADVRNLKGILVKPGREPVPVSEMEAAIRRRASGGA
ncbi:MAG: AbrB/MazE/SpoVT family DNA-binding domain-containing protein [Rhodothermales bacterium]